MPLPLSIGRGPAAGPSDDPVVLLSDCHGRIRAHCEAASKLAQSDEATDEQVRDAARTVHRYFTVALPLHELDEEIDLGPMLKAHAPKGGVADAIDRMVREHRAIDALVADLVRAWDELGVTPSSRRTIASTIAPTTVALADAFRDHLELEESVIFPAVRALPEGDRARLRQAIRDRRSSSMR